MTLIEDGYLDEPTPPRRSGCSIFGWLALLLAIALGIAPSPAPRTAPEPVSGVGTNDVAAASSEGRGLSPTVAALRGTPQVPADTNLSPVKLRLPEVGGGVPQSGGVGTALLGGYASWYDVGTGYYAAAGPLLRDVLGPDWRGQTVTVKAGDKSVAVPLSDSCACGLRHGKPTLLDLSRDAFAQLADPAAGLVRVSIEVGGPEPPRTDADLRMMLEARDDNAYR